MLTKSSTKKYSNRLCKEDIELLDWLRRNWKRKRKTIRIVKISGKALDYINEDGFGTYGLFFEELTPRVIMIRKGLSNRATKETLWHEAIHYAQDEIWGLENITDKRAEAQAYRLEGVCLATMGDPQ